MAINGPGGSSLRKIGWAMVLITCSALYGALHLRVNAVKSEVRLAERQIVALQEDKLLLETEFQTRSNQRQLATWNDVDFGYSAPVSGQYLEGERELAQFGTPRVPGAPAPIMVASAPQESSGKSFADLIVPPAKAAEARRDRSATVDLSARLARGAARVAIDDLAPNEIAPKTISGAAE
jgi:hypothetical protein